MTIKDRQLPEKEKSMKVLENEPLKKYTTFRMGGNAKKMYFPESIEELESLVKNDPDILKYVIGGGSNLIINDERKFDEVLCLREFNKDFSDKGNGRFYIGASVRLQKAIKSVNLAGYGGMEFLFSVPGLIGGALYMNAGTGRKTGKYISDFVVSVDILKNGKIQTLQKNECGYDFRTSVFQSYENCIILGGIFQFPKMSAEEAQKGINDRLELCKKTQDMSYPNFGTVFCVSNARIMEYFCKHHIGFKNGCTYSPIRKNWMLNREEGTFKQAVKLLDKVKRMHKLFRKECKCEVRIWE